MYAYMHLFVQGAREKDQMKKRTDSAQIFISVQIFKNYINPYDIICTCPYLTYIYKHKNM